MLRMFSTRALIAMAAALQVSAGALHAQSYEHFPEQSPTKLTARRVMQAPAPSAWIDRYASMLSVGADPGRVPPSESDPRIARLRAARMMLDSLSARVAAVAAVAASRKTECPMPVAKLDSSRVAEMKVAPRDSGASSPWAVQGRLIGCTNPLAK